MGGAAGHMAHLSEDLDLTFRELKDILGMVAKAEVEATEKVDGLNLFLTVDDMGEIKTARNSSDIRKGGMSTQDYAAKWAGHPAETAFMHGFEVIGQALDSLTPEDKRDIFADGIRYLNMEIMYFNPETGEDSNIINYGASYVVLHGLNSNDPEAIEAFQRLVAALNESQINVDAENWEVYGPAIIKLNNISDSEAHKSLIRSLDALSAGLGGDNATISDLAKERYKSAVLAADFSPEQAEQLLEIVFKRIEDPSFRGTKEFNAFKKSLTTDRRPIASKYGTKTNAYKVISIALRPLERIISDFAIEVLRNVKSAFVVDHDRAVQKLKDDLQTSIEKIRRLDTEGKFDMVRQLEKLGDPETNIASPLEGIVFKAPNGNIYKLTGSFAMVNQIIGRAMRMREPESSSESVVTESILRKAIRRILMSF